MLIVFLAACCTALSGIGSGLPLDTHEVFVARTAEEMLARQSFVVPYFSDQVRLKKPPLCYWLVMAVDRLHDGDGVVSEAEARLPSAIAGVALALLTAMLGRLVGGAWTGLLAGLVAVSTKSFVAFTHSARPEMVYAMFCTAAALGFVLAFQRTPNQATDPAGNGPPPARSAGTARWAWFAWLMMGLAMLTKGPQLPLLIIAGWIIGMLAIGRRRDILRTLRPFTGLLLMAGVSLWWYFALWRSIPNVMEAWRNETTGRIFNQREPLTRYLDPYYLYTPMQLMLPWAALFIAGAVAPLMKELRAHASRGALRILWWSVVAAMVGLSISLGRRDYYMLPMTGVMAVLMAMGGRWLGESLYRSGRARIWTVAAAVHALALAAAMYWLRHSMPEFCRPQAWALAAVSAAAVLAAGLILGMRRPAATQPWSAVMALALGVGVVFFAGAAANGSLWGIDRVPRRQFCLDVRAMIPPDEPLLGWQDIWEIDQYYHHRVIPSFETRAPLVALLNSQWEAGTRDWWILVDGRVDPRRPALRLPKNCRSELAFEWPYGDEPDEVLQVLKVTRDK